MRPLIAILLVYCLIATLAYARALMDLAEEKIESKRAWEQVRSMQSAKVGLRTF